MLLIQPVTHQRSYKILKLLNPVKINKSDGYWQLQVYTFLCFVCCGKKKQNTGIWTIIIIIIIIKLLRFIKIKRLLLRFNFASQYDLLLGKGIKKVVEKRFIKISVLISFQINSKIKGHYFSHLVKILIVSPRII